MNKLFTNEDVKTFDQVYAKRTLNVFREELIANRGNTESLKYKMALSQVHVK